MLQGDTPAEGKWLQRIDIFISSPSDLQAEREIILRIIEKLNRLTSIRKKYILNPLLYENEVPPEMRDYAQVIVDRYMNVTDSYLVVCLMWNRMGTPFTHPETKEAFLSGTEYEFAVAYRTHQSKGEPHLLLYRKTQTNEGESDQKEMVNHFFQKIEAGESEFKGLYKQFASTAEFEDMLFGHIELILNEHPPKGTEKHRIAAETRPEIQEMPRRLDVAMPSQCRVEVPTEVQIMICLPESAGLRAYLPDYTAEGDLIDKQDVRDSHLAVAFPVNKQTGKLEGVELIVEVKATDFMIPEPVQITKLYPDHDSGKLIFSLIPKQTQTHSRVHIIIKSKSSDGYEVALGAGSLITNITAKGVNILAVAGKVMMTLLSIPLGSVVVREEKLRPHWKERPFVGLGMYISKDALHEHGEPKLKLISSSASVDEAFGIMSFAQFKIRDLPVVTMDNPPHNSLLGLVSLRQLTKNILARRDGYPYSDSVEDLMDYYDPHRDKGDSFNYLLHQDSLEKMLKQFTTWSVRPHDVGTGQKFYMSALPIIDDNGDIFGIISFNDVCHAILVKPSDLPIPPDLILADIMQITSLVVSEPTEKVLGIKYKIGMKGQRDAFIVNNLKERKLLGMIPDHVIVENETLNPTAQEILIPLYKLNLQTPDTLVLDMLKAYLKESKVYYYFAVVDELGTMEPPTLLGAVSYLQIFEALLNL